MTNTRDYGYIKTLTLKRKSYIKSYCYIHLLITLGAKICFERNILSGYMSSIIAQGEFLTRNDLSALYSLDEIKQFLTCHFSKIDQMKKIQDVEVGFFLLFIFKLAFKSGVFPTSYLFR